MKSVTFLSLQSSIGRYTGFSNSRIRFYENDIIEFNYYGVLTKGLIVFDETGIISIVSNGHISRDYNAISASVELNRLLSSEDNVENDSFVNRVKTKFKKLFAKKEKGSQ